MKKPTPRQLRFLVTVQAKVDTPDAAGQPVPTWTDEATVRGDYEAATAHEVEVADQVRAVVTGTVTIRGYAGTLGAEKRLKLNGWRVADLILNVAGVGPPDPATGFQTLYVARPTVVS